MDLDEDGRDSDGDRVDMVGTGASFLMNEKVKHKSIEEKVIFLKGKGLSDSEIRKACKKANLTAPEILLETAPVRGSKDQKEDNVDVLQPGFRDGDDRRDHSSSGNSSRNSTTSSTREGDEELSKGLEVDREKVKRAVGFLKHPAVRRKSEREKVQFLNRQGLSRQEIEKAFEVARIRFDSSRYFGNDEMEEPLDIRPLRMNHTSANADENSEKVAKSQHETESVSPMRTDTLEDSENVGKEENLDSETLSEEKLQRKRQADVSNAKVFLSDKKIMKTPIFERIKYLRSKGLKDDIILEAGGELGLESEMAEALEKYDITEDDDNSSILKKKRLKEVDSVALFLRDDKVADSSLIKRITYLRGRNINDDVILEAAKAADLFEAVKETMERFDISEDDSPQTKAEKNRMKDIEDAKAFLQNSKVAQMPLLERIRFLRRKGMDDEIIREAARPLGFENAIEKVISVEEKGSIDNIEDELVRKGVSFLLDERASKSSFADKVSFLKQRGLSQMQIKETFEVAGVPFDDPAERGMSANVQQALSFLTDERTKSMHTQAKIDFLRNKGLSQEEVVEAFKRANLSMDTGKSNAFAVQIKANS